MGQYTLREAAEMTGRSVTTLRRYIRNGKLIADKTPGRFGPEFTLDQESLLRSGFEILSQDAAPAAVAAASPGLVRAPHAGSENGRTVGLERVLLDYVPADLYRELALKHEQLLVQYGMIRASGQRLYEFKDESERHAEDLARTAGQLKELQDRAAREIGFLKSRLRETELELESRGGEIASLREKVRTLELLARNAITSESIEQQFQRVFRKEREIEEMISGGVPAADAAPEFPPVTGGREARATTDPVHLRAGGGPDDERRHRLEALDRWLGNGPELEADALAGSDKAPDPTPVAGLGDGSFPAPRPGRFDSADH